MAGGLGALGGGFLGYELGRMAGEKEQQPQSENSMNPDTITPLSQGGYESGMSSVMVSTGSDFGQMKKFHQATAKDSAQRRTRR